MQRGRLVLEQLAQIAVAEQQGLRVQLGEQPQREQHQPEVVLVACEKPAIAQRVDSAAAEQADAEAQRERRAGEGAQAVGGEIEVGGDAARQVGLQRFQRKTQ